jgi:2-methylcitrate dehydratase PrpD
MKKSPVHHHYTPIPNSYLLKPKMPNPYDKPIMDIVDYVYKHTLDETDEKIWSSARTALLDAMACAISTAATSSECIRLLGPVVQGTTVPDGFRLPGTAFMVDPVTGAFGMGVLIRYLDFNDALGGVEWGHPSGMLFTVMIMIILLFDDLEGPEKCGVGFGMYDAGLIL